MCLLPVPGGEDKQGSIHYEEVQCELKCYIRASKCYKLWTGKRLIGQKIDWGKFEGRGTGNKILSILTP